MHLLQNTKEEMEDGEQEETKSEEEKNGHGNFVSTIHTSMDVLPPSHQVLVLPASFFIIISAQIELHAVLNLLCVIPLQHC